MATAIVALWLPVAAPAGAALVHDGPLGAPSCDDSWVNPTGGTWSTGANWSDGAAPTSSQDACLTIPLSGPVSLAAAGTVAALTLGGPVGGDTLDLGNQTLTLAASSSIGSTGTLVGTGELDVTGGTLDNDGTIEVPSSLQLLGDLTNDAGGQVQVAGTFDVDTGTYTNLGTTFLAPSSSLYAPAHGDTGAVIDDAGGTIANDASIYVGTGATFEQGDGALVGAPAILGNVGGLDAALDLTGDGAGRFQLYGDTTISGNVAAGQTLILDGAGLSTTGSLTNDGTLEDGSGSLTLTVPTGDTLTNDAALVLPPGDALNLVGDVANGADGTVSIGNSSVLFLKDPSTFTNDGQVVVADYGILTTESGGTFDNDGGTLANAGEVTVDAGGTFVEGAGATTGDFVVVNGALELTGDGASSFTTQATTSTLSGDVASGQILDVESTATASGSFTNAGTLFGSGTLVLPTGDTLTNTGTLEVGHGGGGSANLRLEGNLTNDPGGVIGEDNAYVSMETPGTTFDNEGTMYLLEPSGFSLSGADDCGGSEEPACDIDFDNTGTIYWGTSGGTWGGAADGTNFGGSPGDVVQLDGTIVPVPDSEPDAWPPPSGASPVVSGMSNAFSTADGSWSESCGETVAEGWSVGCSGQTTLYDEPATTLIPTEVSFTGTGTDGAYGWTSTYGQPVTLTATVSAQDASTPTGTVTFWFAPQGGASPDELRPDYLGTAPVVTTDGVSTASITFDPPPGSYEPLVMYSGDATHMASDGGADGDLGYFIGQTVDQQTTAVALGAVTSPTPFGAPVTFTATVTPESSAPVAPTGAVTFFAGGTPIGMAPVETSGGMSTATMTTDDLPTGSDSISATYGGDYDYGDATTSSPSTVDVSVVTPQTISVTAPGSGVVDGSAMLSPTASSGLGVDLSVDATSSPGDACSVAGPVSGTFTVSFVHAGTCVLDANQPGDPAVAAAVQEQQTITVDPASQSVTFTTTAPTTVVAGGAGYAPAASATSGLPAVISLDASSTGCTLTSGTVEFTTAGTCVIDANQPGDADWLAALQVQQHVTVTKHGNVITVTSSPPTHPAVGGTYVPKAKASSGDTVRVTLGAGSKGCTLVGGTVRLTATGTCVVDFNDPGNGAYSAAPQVSQSLVVGKGAVKMTASASPAEAVSSKSVRLTAALSPTSAGGAIAFATGTVALCTAAVHEGTATCTVTKSLKRGTYKVTASYAGNASYRKATAGTTFKVT